MKEKISTNISSSKSMELLIATYNPGKIREIKMLLSNLPIQIHDLSEFPHIKDVDETGTTFTENAILKARSYAKQSGCFALADDSGLEVNALNGAPGIYSARYGGEKITDTERNILLLEELKNIDKDKRQARFVCVIALSDARAETVHTFTGTCEGTIADNIYGQKGFGYDPIFIPNGYNQTFGMLHRDIKQSISHRALAIEKTRKFLTDLYDSLT
jgi:XTP/dITP diphosphohydrolase